jgi:hypothetical protein
METKYGKYIFVEPLNEPTERPPDKKPRRPMMRINSNIFSQIGLDFAFVPMVEPTDPEKPGHPSHKHDMDEYIFFFGSDPDNMYDFGAEIEITIGAGEDEEKHIINRACVVYIPSGLPHLPLTVKKVDKPVFWGHILTAPSYIETRL